jgi:hypothetical protein
MARVKRWPFSISTRLILHHTVDIFCESLYFAVSNVGMLASGQNWHHLPNLGPEPEFSVLFNDPAKLAPSLD